MVEDALVGAVHQAMAVVGIDGQYWTGVTPVNTVTVGHTSQDSDRGAHLTTQ